MKKFQNFLLIPRIFGQLPISFNKSSNNFHIIWSFLHIALGFYLFFSISLIYKIFSKKLIIQQILNFITILGLILGHFNNNFTINCKSKKIIKNF